jgi:peptidoglycan/LPS O-acetylase OafA/YrhL
VWVARKRGAGFLVIACAILTVAYRMGLWAVLRKVLHNDDQGLGLSYVTRAFVLGRLFEFSAGMWVAQLLARGAFPRPLFWAAWATLLGGAAAGHLATPLDVVWPVRDMTYGVTFAAALVLTVWPGGAAGRVMGSAPIRWIGECSYSLYLFHMPWVIAAATLTATWNLSGPARFWAMLLMTAPVAVAFARAIYLLVEKPFMSAGRGADGERKAARPVPAADNAVPVPA